MNSTESCAVNSQVNISSCSAVNAPSAEVSPKTPLPTAPVSLSTVSPPQFKTSLVDIDVVAGSSARFVVQILSAPQALNVSWYHNGFLVTSSDRHLFQQEGDFHCVQISQVSPKDEGTWTVTAENSGGGMSCCCILHVTCTQCAIKISGPPVFCPPEFMSGLRGCLWDNGTISLECEVKGKPTPNLRWYKDGTPIVEGASLTIKASSKESDTLLGIFACEAQNCMGSRALYSKVYAKNICDFLGKLSPLPPSTKQPQKTAH